MWKPPINFITLHYAYILGCSILSLIIIYPYGNLRAVDAYFFGASGSTESGLNTVDVKALKTYQQLVIYFIPIITNLGFVNILVVIVRLHWFEKRFRNLGQQQPSLSREDAKLQQLPSFSTLGDAQSIRLKARNAGNTIVASNSDSRS